MHPLTLDILRTHILTPGLLRLRAAFNHASKDIRLVGGSVRDLLLGQVPHDIDLATDATPEEQREIYEKHGVRHIDTGLQHGTWTVVIDDVRYEITTLRIETAHDGRHAEVAWTRDWAQDLYRRDLTINAMALTLGGALFDPFGGERDLRAGTVRFVGDPGERIREDYLRILRFYRFHGRFGAGTLDTGSQIAIQQNREGLQRISRERIWSEVSRIISGPHGPAMFERMLAAGLASYIDLPEGRARALRAPFLDTQEPVSLMVAYLGTPEAVERLAGLWKWSVDERDRGVFLARRLEVGLPNTLTEAQYAVAVLGMRQDWMVEYFRLRGRGDAAEALKAWQVPVFPITGDDLIKFGMRPGPKLGDALRGLRAIWGSQDYKIDSTAAIMEMLDGVN